MSRSYVEDFSKTIDIQFLKDNRYLDEWLGHKEWKLYWETDWKDSWYISLMVNKCRTSWFLRVSFSQVNSNWEINEMDYEIPLVTTSCNYGGVRRWFLCPCWWDRCSVLYLQSNWIFASRKSLNLCYEAQNKSKLWRYVKKKYWPLEEDIEELRNSIKYPYRNWKPTRKQVKLEKMLKQVPSEKEVRELEKKYLKKFVGE